jgi:hypothetical protein
MTQFLIARSSKRPHPQLLDSGERAGLPERIPKLLPKLFGKLFVIETLVLGAEMLNLESAHQ